VKPRACGVVAFVELVSSVTTGQVYDSDARDTDPGILARRRVGGGRVAPSIRRWAGFGRQAVTRGRGRVRATRPSARMATAATAPAAPSAQLNPASDFVVTTRTCGPPGAPDWTVVQPPPRGSSPIGRACAADVQIARQTALASNTASQWRKVG
jgi:hypothetical protein